MKCKLQNLIEAITLISMDKLLVNPKFNVLTIIL